MKIFITGATGYIGQKLAFRLADEGNEIVAFVRNPEKAMLLLSHQNIRLVSGDLLYQNELCQAMQGCEAVYHLAALASVWHKNPDAFQETNFTGLKNILDCCLKLGIKNLVFTSTAGVVGDSADGKPVAEYTNINPKLETDYEKSKVDAENLLKTYVEKGIRGVIVNPSRVYGPGLLTESNGVTRLIKMYVNGKWHIVPGNGKSVGNYVFIDDVVNGHILAMAKAKPGERYLIGGENASFNRFFSLLAELSGKKHWLFKFPISLMLFVSNLDLLLAKAIGKQPLITPPFVRKYNKQWPLSTEKAQQDLGYEVTPLRQGMRNTLVWLKNPTAKS